MKKSALESPEKYLKALPPYYEFHEFKKLMRKKPSLEKSRSLKAGARKLAVGKLLYKYFEPLSRHYHLFEKLMQSITYGYENRAEYTFIERLNRCRELAQTKDPFNGIYGQLQNGITRGFSLVGLSGVGKTYVTNSVLKLFRSYVAIKLANGGKQYQLVYLKIDCSPKGSTKQLCLQIFLQIDRELGTDYYNLYNKKSYTEEALMIQICFVVTQLNLGVLIIDEIQNLNVAKGKGKDLMLNFFKTLSNWIGVPVICIGTTESIELLRGNFQEARRRNGLGSFLWDRFRLEEAEWKDFIGKLWPLQVLKKPGRLSKELLEMYHDKTQGIPDLLVVLHVLVQQWAIDYKTETIDPELLQETAKNEFWMLEPMLEALRTNDEDALNNFGDINIRDALLLKESFDGGDSSDQSMESNDIIRFIEGAKKLMKGQLSAQVIDKCASEILENNSQEDTQHKVELLTSAFKALSAKAKKSIKPVGKKAKKPSGELVKIWESTEGVGTYDDMLEHGVIKELNQFLTL